MQTLPLQLPKICCRCGEKQAMQLRRIFGSRVSGVGYYVIAVSTQRTNYAFNVPICDDCSAILDKSDRRVKIGRMILSLIAAVGFLYVAGASDCLAGGLLISIFVYFALHFTYVSGPISSQSLGGYTGKYFWFSNRAFFKQFAELNPTLVSPANHSYLSRSLNYEETERAKSGFLWSRSNIILLFVLSISVLCIGTFVVSLIK